MSSFELLPFNYCPFFCPNLKCLVVGSNRYRNERNSIISGPWCLLSSLEYVNIESSWDKIQDEINELLS
ncbi:hypothetical protein AtNW77_Chr1g0066771 [Arabidopsis thaliana]